jgi:aryl-alcohol dehydrogenase-like predicted oxidoreductase
VEYRPLGRTGVQVSPLSLGCMNFGWGAEEDDSIRMIHRAMDAGINFLDTANVYARGTSETITGKALAMDGRRDRVFLATKVHGKMDDYDPNAWGNHRYHIVKQCEESLKRLQTDHIDLYQIHRPQPSIPIDETLRALDDLIRAGKVRYVGTSTFAAWQIVESLWVAKEFGLNRFVCEQPPYNLLDRRIERELLPMCRTYGIGVIPWSPLGGGLLTGKYRPGQERPEGARYEKENSAPMGRDNESALDVAEKVIRLAEEKGCSPSGFALAWVVAQEGVTSPIIGPRTMEQLEDNLKALDVKITDDDNARVDAEIEPGSHVSTYYQAEFGPNTRRI